MTPKSLLRHPEASHEPVAEFENGKFHLVLDDPFVEDADRVKRVVLCSGKIGYALMEARE